MKKKGFTLIELLAVIVILAIIALIATPIILNIISDSKEESNKRSVELYGSAVKNAIAKFQLNGSEIPAGDLSSTFLETVQYSGNKVTCKTNKLYEDGSIYLAGCKVGTDTKEYTYGTRQQLEPGAYDNNNNLVADWDTLLSYGLDVESNSSNKEVFKKEELKNVTKLVISDSVTSIGMTAFMDCTSLTDIIIPDSVTSIGGAAFLSCGSLTNVTIPDSVTGIGINAFQGTSLTNVVIPDGVKRIGEGTFAGCTNLTNVTIGLGVTSFGLGVFDGCTNLTSVTFRNPRGWKVEDINTMVETELPELTDPATNVTYIQTYGGTSYGWNRS